MSNVAPVNMIVGKGSGLPVGLLSVLAVMLFLAAKKKKAGATNVGGAT